MTVSLRELLGAANNPDPEADSGSETAPSLLSVGDSLMWGQGLRPEHRFRERVRAHLGRVLDQDIVELSLARSGAPLANDEPDEVLSAIEDDTIPDHYGPGDFSREVPGDAPSTLEQLRIAEAVLDADDIDHGAIRFILLDGGINDAGITNILNPFVAWTGEDFFAGRNAWILDRARETETEMVQTLEEALATFPNATIVVNGYFPVFSYGSIAHGTKLKSIGAFGSVLNFVLPFTLDSLVTASEAWRTASTHHIKAAIGRVSRDNPDRTVLFARSNIEGSHALFAPDSWLWEYDTFPDGVPEGDDWALFLGGATPEDEVIAERVSRCEALDDEPGLEGTDLTCRLASIGHPNVEGAVDYADSIIGILEDEGEIPTVTPECQRTHRRGRRRCDSTSDDWGYGCTSADAAIGGACDDALRPLTEVVSDQFTAAGDRFSDAAAHVEQVDDCYDDTEAKLQQCDADSTARRAACERSYQRRLDVCRNIRCRRFQNCGSIRCTRFRNCRSRFGRWNPRRYICLGRRAACVAGAAAERALCHTRRAGCVAAKTAERVACRATARVRFEACRTANTARRVACKAGVVAADTVCAVGEVVAAVGDVFAGIGHGLVGVGVSIGVGIGTIACTGAQFIVNRGCRFANWIVGGFCRFGVALFTFGCLVTAPVRRLAGTQTAVDEAARTRVQAALEAGDSETAPLEKDDRTAASTSSKRFSTRGRGC
jgi:hypothetical protein